MSTHKPSKKQKITIIHTLLINKIILLAILCPIVCCNKSPQKLLESTENETCGENQWKNSEGKCYDCSKLIAHCGKCTLEGECQSCSGTMYQLQSEMSNSGKKLQFCARYPFFRTWVGVSIVGIGAVILGLGVGFLLYLFCKKEDPLKKWRKFNKVNPLKRMKRSTFSRAVSKFLKKKRANEQKITESMATLGTQGDELNGSSQYELKFDPPKRHESNSHFESVESTYDTGNKLPSEASAIVSRRAGANKNRYAFAFADFANWRNSPASVLRRPTRRRKITSDKMNPLQIPRRVSHFAKSKEGIREVIVRPPPNRHSISGDIIKNRNSLVFNSPKSHQISDDLNSMLVNESKFEDSHIRVNQFGNSSEVQVDNYLSTVKSNVSSSDSSSGI